MGYRRWRLGCLLMLVVALGGAPAVGAATPRDARPWAQGVAMDAQDAAHALFREGVALIRDAFFMRAVVQLRASLEHWDHPATHFNLAKALLNLDQGVDALRHLWLAMRHGGAPLSVAQIDQVARYAALLFATEVAHVVVRADLPGVEVRRGAERFMTGPGAYEGLWPAGVATVVVSRDGVEVGRVAHRFVPGLRTEVAFAMVGGTLTPTVTSGPVGEAEVAALQRRLVGFEVRWPTAEERDKALAAERSWAEQRTAPPANPPLAPPPEAPAVARACARAAGDVAELCGAYRELQDALRRAHAELEGHRRAAEKASADALRRLEEMTSGGIVERLD